MMSLLRNKLTIIKENDTKKFIENFSKNKVSKKFLESCKKANELFKNK